MEEIKMQCPECKSTHIRKNGINKQGKQNHICVTCGRQFIDNYEKQKGYDEKTKRECLTAYMTRVEGENTRLRHYLARLHRQTLCYSKSTEMLGYSIRLLIHYLKFQEVPIPY